MITRIEAYNYRCFPALSVELGRYHVLAGANGAGKTTFLDIPVFVGDMIRARRVLTAVLGRQENRRAARAAALTDLLHKGGGDAISLAIEARLPAEVDAVLGDTSMARLGRPVPTHLRYELQLEVTPRTLRVADEYLFLFSGAGTLPVPSSFPQGRPVTGAELAHEDWQAVIHREGAAPTQFIPESTSQPADFPALRVPSSEIALGAVPADATLFPAATWFAGFLRGSVYFDPVPEVLRSPAPPGLSERLMGAGENMPWLALRLQDSHPEEFAAWIDQVRTALPQIRDIRATEREGDHFAHFTVEYEGGYHVTSPGLSDGTVKIMATTLLPFLGADAMPGLLVTEEPENGIHPRAIETVLESLSMLRGTQVLVSTHSPIVLAHTELRDVLTTRLAEDGSVSVLQGDEHPRLREWRGEVDLGTLFAAGVLS
ncbi:MAG: methylation-associated defense system AAA family ATPase MAD3 [Trebonia sp.]